MSASHAGFRVVKDRGGQGGVGPSVREDVDEVIEGAGAARRDDRNRHGRRHRGVHRAVEAGLRAVAIDRGQQDFTGAAILRLARPLDRVTRRRGLAASRVDREAAAVVRRLRPGQAFRVDGDDHRLAAVAAGERGNQRRIGERRRVQADLVRARIDRGRRVVFRTDAAADRQRNEQLPRHPADRVGQRAPTLEGRGDVEDHQLVDPFAVVAPREIGGIAGRAQPFEVDPLDDLPVADIEAGDDAFG